MVKPETFGHLHLVYHFTIPLSGSVERDLSKVIIVLPTTNETVDVFKQTLTGGFSCVNTGLLLAPKFCYQILMRKLKMFEVKIIITRHVIG